ncbi:MAG: sulfatase-like hydrolase/transferase [Nitrospirae bacterium]|nr:sulfatase-like hydrolase/transferase [Nitrospirota bacterium]
MAFRDDIYSFFKRYLLISLISLIILFISCSGDGDNSIAKSASSAKGKAGNVIVVVIDGLRNDEAFDDSSHQYIPNMWNNLKPQGTINTSFWNTGITLTTSGHTQIVTGVRASLNQQDETSPDLRAKYPNIFEYYRKQKNVSTDKVWFVAGKGYTTGSVGDSLHPDYADFGASSESLSRSDDETWESVQQIMDTSHPSLMVINLAEVDDTGHLGVFSDYTDAIKNADRIVYELWQKIQSDSYYKDQTDLIVTSDHGRHLAGYYTGFKDHGAGNHGCRHIMFLALGPDFKQDETVDAGRDQIDIVPTIGAILGIQTPYAEGEVMTELFNDSTLGRDIVTGGQRRVKLSADSSGLHVVWAQKNGEEWDIYYKKSSDGADTWTDPIKLFENGKDNNYFYEAAITSQDNGMVYVVATGYSLIDEGGDTYTWKVFGRRSLDGGKTWEDIRELKEAKVFAGYPDIASKGDNIIIILPTVGSPYKRYALYQLTSIVSNDDGLTFSDYTVSDRKKEQTIICPSTFIGQNTFYAIWTNERNSLDYTYWNVFLSKSDITSVAWSSDKPITSNTTDKKTFFVNNSIAVNDYELMKILITMRQDSSDNKAGKWKTLIKSSNDSGNTFSDENDFYDPAVYDAWNANVSFTNPVSSDFIVVWEQHYNGNGAEIYAREMSLAGWEDTIQVTSTDGQDSAEPDLATYNGSIYVGWQDYETGDWRIKVQKLNLYSSSYESLKTQIRKIFRLKP